VRALVKARGTGGRFADIEDMLMRVSAKSMNKRIIEALLKAGACKGIAANARAVLEGLGELLERTQRRRKELNAGQSALFEAAEPAPQPEGGTVEAWSLGEQLQAEREVLGFYLTGHPLEEHLGRVSGLADTNLGQMASLADGAKVTLVAAVSSLREHRGARGTMAFVQIEDLHGRSELVCFANIFGKVRDLLQPDIPVLVAARVDTSREEPVLIAEAVESFESALPQLVGRIRLDLGSLGLDDLTLARLKGLMGRDGGARLSFHVHLPDGSVAELESAAGIPWTPELQTQLESRFGRQAVHLECRPWQPVVDQRQKRG
jgi:DNA polymerase-3 subunit alpha